MQKPPDRRTPPILLTRPTYEWISRVNQKHRRLVELNLSPEQKARLDRLVEAEFVYSTLKLEESDVTPEVRSQESEVRSQKREQVTQSISSKPATNSSAAIEPAARALFEALGKVISLARAEGKTATLTVDFLLDVGNSAGAGQGFRRSAGDTSRLVRPVAAESLRAALEGACLWYSADSFAELHPVEQASIVFLRLIDMQPFEQGNEKIALLAASLFTLRSGLPPLIIKPELHSAYRNAVEEGFRMNTKPMVELLAEAIEKSISEMIHEVK